MEKKKNSKKSVLNLTIWLVLLALILRLPLLDGSFWLDEAAQALESARPFSQQLNIIPDFQPPLLHYILHFAMYLSKTEWWLRLVGALIPSIIAIVATYKLATKLFDTQTAKITSLLLATSSFHIFFSQELRPYSLAAMWASLAFLQLHSFIFNKSSQSNFQLVPLIIINILGLYSSYLYPFVILVQFFAVLLFRRKHMKKIFLSLIISTASFLPFLPIFLHQLQAGQRLRTTIPGWELVVSHPQLEALPLTYSKFIYGVIPLDINITFVSISLAILALCLILLALLHQYYRKQEKSLKNWYFLLFLIIFSTLIPWLISFWIPVIQPKRVMYIQPLLYILFASLITQPKTLKLLSYNILAKILFVILLSLNIYGTYQYFTQPKLQRENWRELVAYSKARLPNSGKTVMLFAFDEPFAPWRWYANEHFDTFSTGNSTPTTLNKTQDLIKPIFKYQFVAVFDYLRDLTDPNDFIPQAVESFGYEEFEVIDYPNIGFVRVYTKDKQLLMSSLETN